MSVDPFSAISDPNRRFLLEELRRSPKTVNELASMLPVSRPAVSQHLKALREAGLVRDRREGTKHIYEIDPAGIGALRRWLDQFWDEALEAFRADAERTVNPPQETNS